MKQVIRSSLAIAVAAAGLAIPALSAAQAGSDRTFMRERAVCDGIQQDRAACLREAGAARFEAQRGGLTSAPPTNYEQNALARCGLQPPSDRADCEARVRGTGMTSLNGSVLGGGVIRETVTPLPPVPAPAIAPIPMSAPSSTYAPAPSYAPAPAYAPAPITAPMPVMPPMQRPIQ
ncbi:hypothetical protein [Variovorax sp. KK3]|uniref:hypothetical protein n=1 Tax=Variovorax sp. KK3 TaxID=1855728 RepID=UPI00097BFFAB|nr:hypothetical protein [Variovorax sp. KK3]